MSLIDKLFNHIDAFLIFPYRIFENPMLGFMLGTGLLALWCVVIGKISLFAIYSFNKTHYEALQNKTAHAHDLSIKALKVKDKSSYKVWNSEANDAFGKYFFAQTALGASELWSVPFALGWMSTRFQELSFTVSVINISAGYVAIFILIYILMRILWSRVRQAVLIPKSSI